MPSSYYLATSLRTLRRERFQLLQYGHMANYMGRGTFTATEQLPIDFDANGWYRDYLWVYLEGGIDECVPSIMLPALGTRWMMVLERYDTTEISIAVGAPRRWFNPATGGFGVSLAPTRFGYVSFTVSNTAGPGASETSTASVSFALPPNGAVPGTTTTPSFAITLLASNAAYSISPSSVAISGPNSASVSLLSVDAEMSIVYVQVTAGPNGVYPAASLDFVVSATMQ
jgi:hypothetical protein